MKAACKGLLKRPLRAAVYLGGLHVWVGDDVRCRVAGGVGRAELLSSLQRAWQAALALRAAVPGDCAAIAAIPAQQDGAAEVKPAPARLRVAIYPVGGTPLDSTHAEPRRAKTRERAAFAFA